MGIINQLSIAVAIIGCVLVVACWFCAKNGAPGAEEKLLYALMLLLGALASGFASALSIVVGRFWAYAITMGLAIFALTYLSYRVRQAWPDQD